ncbi:caskin-2-like [Corticium candelabrum]|uniref:caskin-2-like n=1 Tax=Corticium candelabrum TaxID=121492 RepID=UPI002E25BF43|nr:caskin-2-like [Corticium candelabrum]
MKQPDDLSTYEEEQPHSIRIFLQNAGLRGESWVKRFTEAGYDDDTFFIKPVTKKELSEIGITHPGHVNAILREIDSLPQFSLPSRVPKNVRDWLQGLNLENYFELFSEAGYDSENGIASLVALIDDDDDKHCKMSLRDIGIEKPGHLKKLEMGIKAIAYPSAKDRAITKAKLAIDKMAIVQQCDESIEEWQFWTSLIEKYLKPDSQHYSKLDFLSST